MGELLTSFIVTGRGVVATSLVKFKINDPNIGHKGFTGDYLKREINDQYKKLAGIDINSGTSPKALPPGTMALLRTLFETSGKVLEGNQSLINMEGVPFKGFIPTTYGAMVSQIFRRETGIGLKQTSLAFRNIYNRPDDFERSRLVQMQRKDYAKRKVFSGRDGDLYRVMRPIYVEKACLGCHGDPKGARDIAGRKKEGYKLGDLRGAISVAIPMK